MTSTTISVCTDCDDHINWINFLFW